MSAACCSVQLSWAWQIEVHLKDPVPASELANIFRAADIVASPSSSETFGLVALEAQACGAAVLATDADGLRFAVENHRTGLLVAPRTPERWAAAIERLVRAPYLRHSLGSERRGACPHDGLGSDSAPNP